MGKYKKPSLEYSSHLGDRLCHYFANKNLEKALWYNNRFFEPDNFIYIIKKDLYKTTMSELKIIFKKYKNYYKKLWRGEDLTDKTVFVFGYFCGLGDYIIFSRYLRILEKMAKKLIIEVDDNLTSLYRYNFPNSKIILKQPFERTDLEYDYTCHHEHLLNMQKDLNTFPYPEGYLDADPKLVEKFKPLFNTDKLKVGIFHENNVDEDERHIRINKMFPIFKNQQCQFYTLNSDKSKPCAKEIHERFNMIELQPYINDTHDTAALMKNMDLIISTDSFPPNLSGALGIKTYMLLHECAGWRWFNDYYTTPWFNSIKLLRRTPYTTIENQINEMARILEQECAEYYSKKSLVNI